MALTAVPLEAAAVRFRSTTRDGRAIRNLTCVPEPNLTRRNLFFSDTSGPRCLGPRLTHGLRVVRGASRRRLAREPSARPPARRSPVKRDLRHGTRDNHRTVKHNDDSCIEFPADARCTELRLRCTGATTLRSIDNYVIMNYCYYRYVCRSPGAGRPPRRFVCGAHGRRVVSCGERTDGWEEEDDEENQEQVEEEE